jgi:hypothetical protein
VAERIDLTPTPGGGWTVWHRLDVLTASAADPERDAAWLLRRRGLRGRVSVYRDGKLTGVIDLDAAVGLRLPGRGGDPRLAASKWFSELSIAAAST